MKDLPLNLLLLRTSRGLTQAQLADSISAKFDCDVCQSTICRIESRKLEPRLSLIMQFAQYFEVSIDALLASPGNQNS